MDIIFLILGFCLLAEFFYFVSNLDRINQVPKIFKLIIGLSDLIATIIMINILSNEVGVEFRDDDLILPSLGLKLKGWSLGVIVIIGFLESLVLLIAFVIEIIRSKGSRTKGDLDISKVAKAAKLLNLSDNQTKALAYLYKHKHMTMENFQALCPEADKLTLEQDLQTLISLGLAVNKGEEFIIT